VSDALDEICRQVKISDYLTQRGVQLTQAGSRWKCPCPLPDHDDNDPSFYVTEGERGFQFFRCFGCNRGGTIIKLISLIESTKMGFVIGKLSKATGIDASGPGGRTSPDEPTEDEVMMSFCTEDDQAMLLSSYALSFLKAQGGSVDAVNKVSKVYEYLDDMVERGDRDALHKATQRLKKILLNYR
jgi:DNA primase